MFFKKLFGCGADNEENIEENEFSKLFKSHNNPKSKSKDIQNEKSDYIKRLKYDEK